jgi:hypothetical protein
MAAWLHLLLLFASQQTSVLPVHKIDIHVTGPVAMAEVWRAVDATSRPVGNRQAESTFDLSLPEKAALLDWEILERGERARLAEQTEGHVSAGLAAALKMRQLSPSTVPAQEGTDFRIHITPLSEGTRPVLHYRYSMPVGCSDGKLVLRMPESLEEDPVPAEVIVTIERRPAGLALAQASLAGKPAEVRPGVRRLVMRGLSPARAGWEVSWSYAQTTAPFPGQAMVAAAILRNREHERRPPRAAMLAAACLGLDGTTPKAEDAGGDERRGLPSSVVLLVDRSRSVGQGGLSEERLVGRALLEALPPSVPFNAILFGATATPLFALPRMTTREALDAFTNAADPNLLEKRTDLVAALARAASASLGFPPKPGAPAWIVLITDGALPPSQTAERMREALAGMADKSTKVIVLLVRQRGDDSVTQTALTELRGLVAGFGGLVREVPPGGAVDTAHAVIAAMGKGGDWFDLRLGAAKLADELAAGQGATVALVKQGRLARGSRISFSARGTVSPAQGEMSNLHLDLPVASARSEWLEPLLTGDSAKRRAWAGATSSVAVAVLPASPVPKKTADEVVHGRVDETVLRNALALAFIPRARACYLSRRVVTANDAFLRGRLRLQLTIERGELHDAVVRQSTLNNPDVEACVRNAAWAVEYPRPEHRDALTVANLNLVFRPHTPQERRPDASPLDREIELILGPLTFTTNFEDLLEKTPADQSAKP